MVSGPLIARMMGSGQWEAGIGAYRRGFAVLIIFTGVTALFVAASWVGKKAKAIWVAESNLIMSSVPYSAKECTLASNYP